MQKGPFRTMASYKFLQLNNQQQILCQSEQHRSNGIHSKMSRKNCTKSGGL